MKLYKNIFLYSVVIVVVVAQSLQAQKKIEYDGYFEIGGKSEYKDVYVESFYKAKLETKLKINDFAKVELDIRANSEDRQIELYEASASFKLSNYLKLEVGALKKRYGIEEQMSREKLTTIRETMVNQYLEPLGFVSRDPGIQIHWADPDNITKITGGVHFNDSHRTTIVTRINNKGFLGLRQVGAGFQLALERDNDLPNTYAASIDAAQDFEYINTEIELFLGQDPIESYYKRLKDSDAMTNFFGVRALLSKMITVNDFFITGIEPNFTGGFLAKDIDKSDVNSIQLLLGVNIYFDQDVRLMINGDLQLSNHAFNKTDRTMYGSNVIAQLQVRW